MVDKAVVLLSGGLDSTTVMSIVEGDFEVHALTVSYGQKHTCEIAAARRVAAHFCVPHQVVVAPVFSSPRDALTQPSTPVPVDRSLARIASAIAPTYVAARNTVLLSLALSLAEAIEARRVFVGISAADGAAYPDCRQEFLDAFQTVATVGTAAANIRIEAPLIDHTKQQVIERGLFLEAPYALTHTCYDPQGELACGRCDACTLRLDGWRRAGAVDPIAYA